MSDHLRRNVAVVGLRYVGSPVAVAYTECYPGIILFDIDVECVSDHGRGLGRAREVDDPDAFPADASYWRL